MNFMKYHVSRNLFNVSSKQTIGGRIAYDCSLTIGQTYTFTNCSGYVLGFKISNWPSGATSVQTISIQPNEWRKLLMSALARSLKDSFPK